ncbi:hypothetical protein N7513_001938 [Penicillium frequentans]|nr:hypothetical protein N7513_001938 [Penicillium glabrum]
MRYDLGCICAAQDRGTRGDLGAPSIVHGNLFDLHLQITLSTFLASRHVSVHAFCMTAGYLIVSAALYIPGFVHPERKEPLLLVNTPVFPRGFAAVCEPPSVTIEAFKK